MVAVILSFFLGMAQAETAEQVVERVQRNLMPGKVNALYEFVNHRTDGTTTQYELKFLIKDFDHSHGYFQQPPRERGREMLRSGESLWTWVPNVGRAIRIADKDSFAGGDFSNADVMRVDWLAKYKSEMAKETANQWIIDLVANHPEAPYAKMRLWVDKKNTQPVQQFYFDSKGTLLKRCLYGSIKNFGTVTRPARLVMENVITGQKSEMKVLGFKTGEEIPDSVFVVDNLGKK